MRKSERQRFVRKVTELLLSLGAKQDDGETYRFTLQTKAGVLHLHPDESQTTGLGTLFTRFDNPQAARQIVDCNRQQAENVLYASALHGLSFRPVQLCDQDARRVCGFRFLPRQ